LYVAASRETKGNRAGKRRILRQNPEKEIDPVISIKKVFTFPVKSCIVIREQSRRQRVKCHRDGEFARRTKDFSTMLSPHPLLHIGKPPYM